MRSEINTQIFGISLGVLTAIGCLAYERLVKSLPYASVCFFVWLEYFWIWMFLVLFGKEKNIPDISYWKSFRWPIFIFLLSGFTSPIWYWLTKKHSVLVGGTFEIKYIIILGILSIIAGEQKPTINTYIGAILAIFSVYFISKNN